MTEVRAHARTEHGTRVAGRALTGGALVLLVANVGFPRAADPWDVPAVLTMMVDDQTRRQASFVAVTVGLWAVVAGLIGLGDRLGDGGAEWARLARHLAVVGVTLFTAASALGLAATGAAVEWAAAGGEPASPEYAVAAALNRADDYVWYLSIIAFWGAVGLYGLAMLRSGVVPRWLGAWALIVGPLTALLVGLPLALGAEVPALLLAFGGLGGLTTVWALLLGIWTIRTSSTPWHADEQAGR
jgi:hypothetical protein